MAEENVIDVFCNRINFDKDKIKSKELGRIEVDSFNLSDFWAQFGAAVQALSNEVTKLGFMCGKKPFPSNQEVTAMLQDVVQYYTVMKDLYLVLPEEVGDTLFQAVTSAIVTIMSALHDIVQSLKDLSDQGSKERLAFTGTFWDACNAVDNLPRDNLQATLKVIQGETALAVDAQEELDTNRALPPTSTSLCRNTSKVQPNTSLSTGRPTIINHHLLVTSAPTTKFVGHHEQYTNISIFTNHGRSINQQPSSTESSSLGDQEKMDTLMTNNESTHANDGPCSQLKKNKTRRGKRKTMKVTLPDGTRKRINVRKLGLPKLHPINTSL